MDIRIKPRRRLVLLGTCLSVAAVALIGDSLNMFDGLVSQKRSAEVTLKDFSPKTEIDYKILVDGKLVDSGEKVFKENGEVSLPAPVDIAKNEGADITYQLRMSGQDNGAKDMDLSLQFEAGKGDFSFKGRGIKQFSDITVSHQDGQHETVSADWAGMFVAQARKSGVSEAVTDDKTIELAFQNADILQNDLEQYAPGKVEVFFGDGSGSNVGRVQRRYSWALVRMTEELSAVMVMQTQAIGMFFDASIQLSAQRKMQELHARAHKDYHPSEQMCRIGTFMRSVAHSESKADRDKHALNRVLMNQYMAMHNSSADGGPPVNQTSELHEYAQNYCDRRDNDGAAISICPATTSPTRTQMERRNKDVDYPRILATKLTLDIDYNDQAGPTAPDGTRTNTLTNDEEDIIALAKNLYFPNSFAFPEEDVLAKDLRIPFDSRNYAARMNVAHNTFLNIVGMKSSAPAGQPTTATATTPPMPRVQLSAPPGTLFPATARNPVPPTLTEDAGWAYMKALLFSEFDIADANNNSSIVDEIEEMLGERPSYYAQMEVLTKKIFQHPNFYTNLYDKPANVDRIGASLDAITIMHQRDRFDSMLRSEMLSALLVEENLQSHVEEINTLVYEGMQSVQAR